MNEFDGVVSVDWLSEQLVTNDDLVLLQTAMANPFTGERPAIGERVIPAARHFDFERVFCDLKNPLPHTMPSAEDFEREARRLGINNRSVIVVYDDQGIYCSPRVWWMFKAMGHRQVYVLDGGLPAWIHKGFDHEVGFSKTHTDGDFEARYQSELVLDLSALLEVRENANCQVVDARSQGRFYGVEAEPREGVRQGHIPKSKNLPFDNVLSEGHLQSRKMLSALFEDLDLDKAEHVIFSCGSGVSACILALAAYRVGYMNLAIYDGSWSEWGANEMLPIEVGKVSE